MNQEIKEQWTAALRSGEYRQGNGSLNYNGTYCCLGVLCDLGIKAGVEVATFTSEDGEVYYGNDSKYPPQKIQEWAGLEERNPIVDRPDATYKATLAELNDEGKSFGYIADVIDTQL